MTTTTTTTRKVASSLQAGDRIVTSHPPGLLVHLNRICSVERFDAQRIRVRVEGHNGWIYYLVEDHVRVLARPALSPGPRLSAGLTR